MKTITQISEATKSLKGLPFTLTAYSFSASKSGVSFTLEFCKKHIQSLIEMGVKFDFKTPFNKSRNQNGNQYTTTVRCSVETMVAIDKFVRDNHVAQISMLNDHQLVSANFPLKGKEMSIEGFNSRVVDVLDKFEVENLELKAHLMRISEIRKDVRRLMNEKKIAPSNNYMKFCATKKVNY